MDKDDNNPAVKEPPDEAKDGKRIQAESQSDTEPFDASRASVPELRKASEDLKTRITEAKRHNDLPVDSALGSPRWERSVADGRLDQPEEDDDK
jgi:hypothetical protein